MLPDVASFYFDYNFCICIHKLKVVYNCPNSDLSSFCFQDKNSHKEWAGVFFFYVAKEFNIKLATTMEEQLEITYQTIWALCFL